MAATSSRNHFSLTRGGPVDRLLERIGVSPQLAKRISTLLLVSWLPLLLLAAGQKLALGSTVQVPFLRDMSEQVRFLLALPLLITAEPIIDASVQEAAQQFLKQDLILEVD